ncbi:MAG: M42 family peptidase [Chloroflexi bacterium]|nr:M42 family peptidase [Chloroflexota bacterium]
MFETLKTLCELPGPGGREDIVHRWLMERWQPQLDSAWMTPVGNLVGRVGGQGPRLMLIGHGDEIGYAVRHISDDGFLFISTGQREGSGKPDFRGSYFIPLGQPALVVSRHGTTEGVFATLTGHILTTEQRQKLQLDWNDFWVDLFMDSREAVLDAGIQVGDRVIWNPPTRRHGSLYTGKAMDNRVSLAVMDEVLNRVDRSRLQYDLYYGSTVQEESGLYGAHSINRDVNCTYAISIDTGLSGDVPGVDRRNVSTRLGGGPILIHKDLYGYNFALNNHIIDAATAAGIALQHAVYSIYGTDSGALIREGAAASAVVVPTRYTHSPFETVHADDLDATVNLLLEFLYRPPPEAS